MPLSVEELAKCAASAELTPLLCALAEATGDRTLLEESFRPKLQAEMIVVPADGGVPRFPRDARFSVRSV